MKQRVAVKAFIVNDSNELLLVKRSNDDDYKPGVWELPGGKVDIAEDPNKAIIRETKEETGLAIKVVSPLNIQHFKIEKEKFWITMIIYLCKSKGKKVKLSGEHSEYKWVNINDAKTSIAPFFKKEIEIYKQMTQRFL